MTKRQEQIVAGIARKRPFKAIAADLGVSISTAANHAAQLAVKYGVRRTKELPGEVEYRSWR